MIFRKRKETWEQLHTFNTAARVSGESEGNGLTSTMQHNFWKLFGIRWRSCALSAWAHRQSERKEWNLENYTCWTCGLLLADHILHQWSEFAAASNFCWHQFPHTSNLLWEAWWFTQDSWQAYWCLVGLMCVRMAHLLSHHHLDHEEKCGFGD